MKRTLLVLGAGAALGSVVVSGAFSAPPETAPARPERPAIAPAKPTPPAAPGKSEARMKPVVVTYAMKGTITQVPGEGVGCTAGITTLTTGEFALDVTSANRHAKRLMTTAEVSIAGTDAVTVKTAVGTVISREGPATAADLKCGDTALVVYRAAFRTTGRTERGRPTSPAASAFTLAGLLEKSPRRVTVTELAAPAVVPV